MSKDAATKRERELMRELETLAKANISVLETHLVNFERRIKQDKALTKQVKDKLLFAVKVTRGCVLSNVSYIRTEQARNAQDAKALKEYGQTLVQLFNVYLDHKLPRMKPIDFARIAYNHDSFNGMSIQEKIDFAMVNVRDHNGEKFNRATLKKELSRRPRALSVKQIGLAALRNYEAAYNSLAYWLSEPIEPTDSIDQVIRQLGRLDAKRRKKEE